MFFMFHTVSMMTTDVSTFYLSSDSAGEPPHGFIRGVVFTSTPHLKRKGHSVSFHLKQGTENSIALKDCCVFCVFLLCMFAQNSFLYLDEVFGPSCPQHTATAVSQSVPSVLSYFTTVRVGTSIDHQLRFQKITLIKINN